MSIKNIQDLIPHKQMQFQPVEEDDDELSQSIKNDPITHDNTWDLNDSIDASQLDAFWDEALQELGGLKPEQDDDLA